MGIFDSLLEKASSVISDSSEDAATCGVIPYGKQKKGGGHNHTYNTGDDRTRAQKEGDEKRRKDG